MTSPTEESPISADEFADRIVALCVSSGLRIMPRRKRDQHILMKSVVLTLDPDASYGEIEINNAIKYWLVDIGKRIRFDHLMLRRMLVDRGYLDRDRRGSAYTVGVTGDTIEMFDANVSDVDVYRIIGEGLKSLQDRKKAYLKNQ